MYHPDPLFADDKAQGTCRFSLYRNGGKRMLDLFLVLCAVPLVILLMFVITLLVACQGGSPFYCQKRLGQNGRLFWLYKFRSMKPDADKLLQEHLAADPAARAEWDANQKLRNDPRITTVGRIIRKTSLDELPQLINVLKGDMSLVGPRPMMPEQREFYPGDEYELLRPGLTGLWQVSERNGTTFAARALYDGRYNETLSLKVDLQTMFRTVSVVLNCTGC